MTDDVTDERLRDLLLDLPPELAAPPDRMTRVRGRVVRRRRAKAVVAALAVALLAGGAGAVQQQFHGVAPARPNSLRCPPPPAPEAAAAPSTVPASPTADTGGHLVPRAAPTRVIGCTYSRVVRSDGVARWEVYAHAITRDREALAADLWWLPARSRNWPAPCEAGSRSKISHLLGLSYPDGTVWVATPGPGTCGESTNGDFVAGQELPMIDRSIEVGRWLGPVVDRDPPEGLTPCDAGPETGRFGQETTLVPDAPVEVLVCETVDPDGDGLVIPTQRAATVRDGVTGLVAELNAYEHRVYLPPPGQQLVPGSGCPETRPTVHYSLIFRYAEGPPVRLEAVIGCEPELVGSSLVAYPHGDDLAARFAALVDSGEPA